MDSWQVTQSPFKSHFIGIAPVRQSRLLRIGTRDLSLTLVLGLSVLLSLWLAQDEPFDGSETAALGLSEAIRLAKNQGAMIKLVHIVNELLVVLPEAYIDMGRAVDSLRSSGKTILANGGAAVRDAGVEVDTKLVEAMGNAAGDQIIQLAIAWGTDLIVCGAHE